MLSGNKIVSLGIFILAILSQTNANAQPESRPQANTVMVFAPHPDDDILGSGGSVIQHLAEGSRVIIVYMTSGEGAFWASGPVELARIREKEAQAGAHALGVKELVFLREPDGRLHKSNESIQKVADLLSKNSPELIYIPHCIDEHWDHMTTHTIVVDAVKSLSADKRPIVLGYEVWTPLQTITHVANISDEISLKLEALEKHKSQIAHINYVEAVKALNRFRGIMIAHASYAECFQEVSIA